MLPFGGVRVYNLVRLIGRSVCSNKVVEDFWDVHFPHVMAECRAVDSNMNIFFSFFGNLFTILVCYLEVGDVGSGMFVGNTVFVNYTGDMIIVFFYSIFQNSSGISYVGKVTIFFWTGPFLHCV